MENTISVIIPVYNVEPYLRQCLDSVVNQTYRNLEILLIDDGSPDHCGEICDEYAKKDSRIRVAHKQNGGLSAAWNDGLAAATGEWVAFVDSDDWLDIDYFEKMLQIQRQDSADVIQSGGYYWEEQRGQFIRWAFKEEFFVENKDREKMQIRLLMRSSGRQTKGAISFTWGKLFRRQLLVVNGCKFDTKIRAGLMTDTLFDWDVFEMASLIVGIPYCGYHYRVTNTSGTGKFDPERAKRQEYVERELYKRINKGDKSTELELAMESRCLRDIVHNLRWCYFHPDNLASGWDIAKGIREMKQMPYYKAAIESRNNPYNDVKLRIFQIALRLPWVWPLRIMVAVWNIMDKQEKTAQ